MKIKRFLILFFVFIVTSGAIIGKNIDFTLSGPSEVAVGARFQLTFQINTNPSNFKAPDFEGFKLLSGPNQSTSTSIQIINNQTTRTVTFSYTYILEATDEGRFTIDPATAIVDGRGYKSNDLSINVTPATQTPQPGNQSNRQPPSQQDQRQQQLASADDLFIRATVNNRNPYMGDQVIITYRLFTRVSVSQYSVDHLPSYRGFWSEDLTLPGNPQTSVEVIDGKTYRVAEIRRIALFPQRDGELTIEPLEVELVVNLPSQRRNRSLFDEFFGGVNQVRQDVKSNKVVLNVQPLPAKNQPAAFTGLVGTNFDIKASINKTDIEVNEATNLKVTISGEGNLNMVEAPQFSFPANLEVFDPNITNDIRTTQSGLSGERTFDFLMIPRTGGDFEIPPYNFVYFNPRSQSYETIQTPEFLLQVRGSAEQTVTRQGAASQEDIQTIGEDIRFIKTGNVNFRVKGEHFAGSTLFWLLIILPFLLFAVFILIWRNKIRLESDQQLLKTRKAEKIAKKRLKKANNYLKQRNENNFYDEIFRALWGYLSDKLNIPVSILNKETVDGAFKAKKVDQKLSDSFMKTLNECEFARFAPGEKEDKMDDIYNRALETIVLIEKDLKNK